MISTRGRYALRVLLELAESQKEGYIAMKQVAMRQELSLKYIEQIMPVLSKNHYVEGVQGKGGGYRLVKAPEEYRVGDILRLTEGNLAPVACLECDAKMCRRANTCKTLPMWKEFHQMVLDYFDNITLLDLLNQEEFRRF
ncbi:RrF2 family transcriptional regulator [Dorea phocaeensis]